MDNPEATARRTGEAAEAWTIERFDPQRDLDAVLHVEDESFFNPWTRQMYLDDVQRADVSFIHVLRSTADGVVGVCSAWLVADELHINNMAVRPAWRGRGLGRRLLLGVLGAAARGGARRATLEVRRSNAVARQLYAQVGFRHVGTRPGFYRNPDEDALILWKDDLLESPGGV